MYPEDKAIADILIVEDEAPHAEALHEGLSRMGHHCSVASDGETAITQIKARRYDIVVTDLFLGGPADGLAVLQVAAEYSPATKVILITAHSSVETCRKALQQGAFDYIEKPLDIDELRAVVTRAAEHTAQKRVIEELRCRLDERYGFDNIVGNSSEMLRILMTVQPLACSDLSVLILGESGTGKELLANAIHHNSQRSNHNFVPINCAGLSESLLEDELFGHVKGAFTGATTARAGRFEHAHGGTLFLDEIGDMPATMQAKLLRVLENGEVIRVGANEGRKVDVRVISATNTNLAERVESKEFRQDLYFRIKGATIEIPPLRRRREDIPLLIDQFISEANKAHKTNIKGITKEASRALMAYPWPGNVRQLRNVVENMVVLAGTDKLTTEDLPADIQHQGQQIANLQMQGLAGISIEDAEKQLIANTLKMVSGNREQAAGILGIGERTLYRKIKEYGLT